MSEKVSRSKLLQKITQRTKGTWKKAKKVESKAKGQMVPDGLSNALCKFTSWGLAETKTKTRDPYVTIKGVLLDPPQYKGTAVTKFYFFKDSPRAGGKTASDRLEEFANDVKLIAGDDDIVESTAELAEICDVLDTLVENGTYYTINTWKPPKNKGETQEPQVQIFIQGAADGPEEDEEEAEDEEESDEEADEEEEEEEEEDDTDSEEDTEEEESEDEEQEDDEEEDEEEEETPPPKKRTGSVTKKAATTTKSTKKTSTKSGSPSKTSAAKKPKSPPKVEEEDEEDDEEASETPSVGDMYLYARKPKAKPEECEVIKVNTKTEKLDIKFLKDDHIVRGLSWSVFASDE